MTRFGTCAAPRMGWALMVRALIVRTLMFGSLMAGALAAVPAAAEDDPVTPFLGTYVGSATVYNRDGGVEEQRDMDITVAEAARGAFTITWINVTLVDGRRDVPGVQRRVDVVTLTPGDRPGMYTEDMRQSMFETRRRMDPMAGDPVRWARIQGGRIGTYALVIGQDGGYELQTYERALTPAGLDIEFRRIINGVVERRITGHTVRVQ